MGSGLIQFAGLPLIIFNIQFQFLPYFNITIGLFQQLFIYYSFNLLLNYIFKKGRYFKGFFRKWPPSCPIYHKGHLYTQSLICPNTL